MFKKILNVLANAVIDATSVAAGVGSMIYCVNHDPFNDQEVSTIVGAASGTAIAAVTNSTLHGIKDKITSKNVVDVNDIEEYEDDE